MKHGVEHNMNIREYAEKLLKEFGCALDCYKGEWAKYALPDMQELSKERDIPFPLESVAKVIIEIGNEQPDPPSKGHKQFCMIFDVGHSVDGIEFDTFEAAKTDAIDTLINWMAEETVGWKTETSEDGISVFPHPTNEQIESWDDMINTCSVYVVEWDETKNGWQDADEAWFPSHEDEKGIGWMEWEQCKKEYGW